MTQVNHTQHKIYFKPSQQNYLVGMEVIKIKLKKGCLKASSDISECNVTTGITRIKKPMPRVCEKDFLYLGFVFLDGTTIVLRSTGTSTITSVLEKNSETFISCLEF